ncbi:hypothetical protein, partial [Streptococcus dysgalactiae]|uniref:hypothetical protein n=1 Tax=Streptococcus dysgalactiae TaxID=1334 RepID=UPI0039F46344
PPSTCGSNPNLLTQSSFVIITIFLLFILFYFITKANSQLVIAKLIAISSAICFEKHFGFGIVSK